VIEAKVFDTAEEWNSSFFTTQVTMKVKVALIRLCGKTELHRSIVNSLTKVGEMK